MRNISSFKKRSIITLFILLSISFGLMFFNLSETIFIRKVIAFITYPIELGTKSIGEFFGNLFNSLARINQLEKELSLTKERLKNYQEKLLLYSKLVDENAHLKKVLSIKESLSYDTIYARIMFRDPTLMGNFYIINKGIKDNITENMPVVSYDSNGNLFLVGKTVEVNLTASKVKLITAKNFYVGVALESSGYVGILNGQGAWNQNCVVDYIPSEIIPQAGERVVTSGESDIFPYGITVGKVVGVRKSVLQEFFQKLYIRPEYNYPTLRDVFILKWKPSTEIKSLIESSYE